jgi:hypothetical protein
VDTLHTFFLFSSLQSNTNNIIFQFSIHPTGVTYLLTQLPEDKKFLVRVASRNAAGLSDWAPFKIFATLPLHPHGINGAVNLNKSINFLPISILFIFNWINR